MTTQFTDVGLQAIRDAVGAPRTLAYLWSNSERTWFGDPVDRTPLAWVDLLQWRALGRPYELEWNIYPWGR